MQGVIHPTGFLILFYLNILFDFLKHLFALLHFGGMRKLRSSKKYSTKKGCKRCSKRVLALEEKFNVIIDDLASQNSIHPGNGENQLSTTNRNENAIPESTSSEEISFSIHKHYYQGICLSFNIGFLIFIKCMKLSSEHILVMLHAILFR